jgi:DNA mismatch repair protein MutS2
MNNKSGLNNRLKKLDLLPFIESFSVNLSREKSIELKDSIEVAKRFISELEKVSFVSPLKLSNLDGELKLLKKLSTLKLNQIVEFIKIIKYFRYLKKVSFKNILKEWLDEIIIPDKILIISDGFDKNFDITGNIELDTIKKQLEDINSQISYKFNKLLTNNRLRSYLQSFQIHYINEEETILVKSGYQSAIDAKVVNRSGAGFFYVIPKDISKLKDSREKLLNKKDDIIYEICKEISALFAENIGFVSFINRAFDKFDGYQARAKFARENDYNFIFPNKTRELKIVSYSHPAISNPKPITLQFDKKILLITGVNAGGKTMLLKSILATLLLSKHLIPMNIHKSSTLPYFKNIMPILDDPQNVSNNISTFAGRMMEFGQLFDEDCVAVGIDEIEIGTDSDEAASLFDSMLRHLKDKDIKIIATTHHKRLATMLADEECVELLAATYDEKNRLPTYSFLPNSIGKSYAFETAIRYGIPKFIIDNASKSFSTEQHKMEFLAQKGFELQKELENKTILMQKEIDKLNNKEIALKLKYEEKQKELEEYRQNLEKEYKEATTIAKSAIKTDSKTAHKKLNIAHKMKKSIDEIRKQSDINLKVGEHISYFKQRGHITSISSKSKIFIELENGKKAVVSTNEIIKVNKITTVKKPNLSISNINRGTTSLNLHGLRGDEAIDRLEIFLSDCLINGFEEVLVIHGLGSGILAKLVKELLESHPKVESFCDAPPNMGGTGAKIVKF